MFIDLVFMLKNKDSENDIDLFKENFADLISFKEKHYAYTTIIKNLIIIFRK